MVTLITGAASGLGRELARRLTSEGERVGGVDLATESLQVLAQELNGRHFSWATADTTDRASLDVAVRGLEQQLGPIERLIACAGVGRPTPAAEFNSSEFEAIVRVNLIGVANSVAAVLPGMIGRKRGHLVAISSLASFRGLPQMAAYCASKSGLNALFDSLRMELRPHGIDVSTVCPGWVRTPMTAPLGTNLPHMLDVTDAAQRILATIRRRRRFAAFPFVPAALLKALRLFPPSWGDFVIRRQQKKLLGNAATGLANFPGPTVVGPKSTQQ